MKYYHYAWPGSTLHGRVGRIHVEVYTTRHGSHCLEVLLILDTNSAEFILDNTSSFFATVQDVIAD